MNVEFVRRDMEVGEGDLLSGRPLLSWVLHVTDCFVDRARMHADGTDAY